MVKPYDKYWIIYNDNSWINNFNNQINMIEKKEKLCPNCTRPEWLVQACGHCYHVYKPRMEGWLLFAVFMALIGIVTSFIIIEFILTSIILYLHR